ncbi:hypothetical protein [Thaumasiovibrio sp. DFM-14]|uniref:hypothetical protein n=1 Tax=Thaumasiovibrio sp. DFM-14 TaxID=3384792 RepID=UPI0039A00A69
MSIPFSLSNVAKIAISEVNGDATLATGGSGMTTFAGLVLANKGKPFEVLSVNRDNWRTVLGQPWHPTQTGYESLRHVNEAVQGGSGLVVRVVPSAAKYPYIKLVDATVEPSEGSDAQSGNSPSEAGAPVAADNKRRKAKTVARATAAPKTETVKVENGSQSFGSDVELEDGDLLAIWIEDGDASANRAIEINKADEKIYGEGMFTLRLMQRDESGNEVKQEEHYISFDPVSVNDMGAPAYIVTVLENANSAMRAIVGQDADKRVEKMDLTYFTGGTGGNLNQITNEDYMKAVQALRSTISQYTAVLGLGCYDEAILNELTDICTNRRIDGFFDVPSHLSYDGACEWLEDLSMNNHRTSWYHLPFSSKDPFFGSQVLYGMSGLAFRAKSIGVAKNSPTGGWHYTAAGQERATIDRPGLRPLPGIGLADEERMYRTRLNKVGTTQTGALFIDDSLTACVRENHLRYQQVSSVADAISRDFYALCTQLKHQPDGVTGGGLEDGMTRILDSFVATGALVTPTDPADGSNPYEFWIEKAEHDLWQVRWAICVTGSARRFLGQPELIR